MGQPEPTIRHLDKSLQPKAYRKRKMSRVRLSVPEHLRQAGGDSEGSEAEVRLCLEREACSSINFKDSDQEHWGATCHVARLKSRN